MFAVKYVLMVIALVILTFGSAGAASASTIYLDDFESPTLTAGAHSAGMPGWDVTGGDFGSGSGYIWAINPAQWFGGSSSLPLPSPAGGNQLYFNEDLYGSALTMTTDSSIAGTVKGTTYTLSVAVFDRNDSQKFSGLTIDLLDNGASAALKTVPNLGSAGWELAETSFVASATGDTLNIQIIQPSAAGGLQIFLDNVRVEATTPEPGTLVLLGTALIGLLAYAWQKRK